MIQFDLEKSFQPSYNKQQLVAWEVFHMAAMAQNCHDVRESYRSSLVGLELDDLQTQMLLSITRRHCKLGVGAWQSGYVTRAAVANP